LRFSGLILENIFMVFLGSSCRETAKNAIKKKSMGKDEMKKVFFPQLFRPKAFDMDFPQKVFYGVFELPLLRSAQKRHKQNLKNKTKKQKGTYLPDLLAICQIYPRFIFFFLSAPCAGRQDFIRIPSAGSSQKRAGSRGCTGEVYPNPAPPSAGAHGGSLAAGGPTTGAFRLS
jgi:hypothetical protein